MSQRTVGIVMNRLLGDEDMRFRFALDRVETPGGLHADGLELTPSEIDLFLESDLEMWKCARPTRWPAVASPRHWAAPAISRTT